MHCNKHIEHERTIHNVALVFLHVGRKRLLPYEHEVKGGHHDGTIGSSILAHPLVN